MVRGLVLAGMVAVFGGQVRAQAVDWSEAGGDLFGVLGVSGEASGEAGAVADAEAVRLAELDAPFRDAMIAAAARHNIDVKLLQALVLTESGFRADAISPAGAAGLTQLMPSTARELGVRNPLNPEENLAGGADYLARQLLRFGDVRLALAAYNAGPSRVERLGRVPRITETEHYVETVIECYLALTAGRRPLSATACRTPGRAR